MTAHDRLYADPSTMPWYQKAWAIWRGWTTRHRVTTHPVTITRYAWPAGRQVITGRHNPSLAHMIQQARTARP